MPLTSFKLSLFLLSVLPIIWSGRHTKLADYMMLLDRNITAILSGPTEEQGEPLLYVLDEYITHIRDVNHLLRFNPKFMYKTAKFLYEEGAPLFLHVGIDQENLHETFRWEDFRTEGVVQYIKDIRNYTETFKVLFSNLSPNEFDKYDYETAELN